MGLWLLVGVAVAALVGVGLVLWRTPPAPVPPRVERVNLDRRVRNAMLDELRGTGRKWTAKQLKRELRKQVRDQRNGNGAA